MIRRPTLGQHMPAYCGQVEAKVCQYPFHPVCEMLPWMSEQEFLALAEDIRSNGLIDAITRYKDQIVDGKHRLTACLVTGIKPRFVEWDGQGSLISWIASKNLPRRHLTPSQRAAIAVDLLPELEKEAKERQREGGRVAKDGATLPIAGKASEFAAKMAGSNPRYVEAVKSIQCRAPELLREIRTGSIGVPDAVRLARLSPSERRTAIRMSSTDGISARAIVGDSDHRREKDRYYTELREIDALLGVEKFPGETLDPCAGDGRIVRQLRQKGCTANGTDIDDGVDFFAKIRAADNIVTNPPWDRKDNFILHAMKCAKRKIALLLPLFALSGIRRLTRIYSNREFPLKCVYVISHRLQFDPNGEGGSTIVGGWFVWERTYKGEPVIRWLP